MRWDDVEKNVLSAAATMLVFFLFLLLFHLLESELAAAAAAARMNEWMPCDRLISNSTAPAGGK